MMRDIGFQCDSFDEEDIQDLQAELQFIEGPSLDDFHLREECAIVPLTLKKMMKSVLDQDSRDLKLIGNERYSEYLAFFYVLLLVGAEERRNYPHLNTLIREQFYKPNIFQLSDQTRAEQALAGQMLDKSLKYFQQLSEGVRLEDYLTRQPIFEEAGTIMLRNSIEPEDERGVLEQLAAKFNIDMQPLKREDEAYCYQFGANKRYHIFRECEYYFVATSNFKEDLGNSRYDIESVRSGESGLQLLPEASEHSTPKFKNSEAKMHKKSHKNSFGGDLEIVQYRDLLHMHGQRMNKMSKVLSEYMDLNEIQSEAQHLVEAGPKTHTFEDIIKTEADEVKAKTDMKGSTTIEPHQHFADRRKDRKISSSEIIQCRDFVTRLARHDSLPQAQEEFPADQFKGHSYNSVVMLREEPSKMRTSIIKGKQLQRIQQRQSSQKESTHHDQSQSDKEYEAEMGLPQSQNQIQMKLKDRKYSYFTQQMASSKSQKQKEIQNSNYVFKLPKNNHKNSEVILTEGLESEYIKRRFEENPLRFSQLDSPSEESYHGPRTTVARQPPSLKLNSTVYSYLVKFEPDNWYKKQIIYHLPNNVREVIVFQKSFPRPISPLPPPEEHRNQSTMLRDSMGSSNSYFSNLKSQQSFTTKDQGGPPPHQCYNPYELNESSFLKNRIQSMSQLQPFRQPQPSEDSKSVIFPSSKSLRSIRLSPDKSPPKIHFNYRPSQSGSNPSPSFRPRNLPFISSPQLRPQGFTTPAPSALQNRFSQVRR